MDKSTAGVSKFLSYILRHHPEAIGLTLDGEGWADVDELLTQAAAHGRNISLPLLHEVVATNPIIKNGLRCLPMAAKSVPSKGIPRRKWILPTPKPSRQKSCITARRSVLPRRLNNRACCRAAGIMCTCRAMWKRLWRWVAATASRWF